jgi:hypothetical protein
VSASWSASVISPDAPERRSASRSSAGEAAGPRIATIAPVPANVIGGPAGGGHVTRAPVARSSRTRRDAFGSTVQSHSSHATAPLAPAHGSASIATARSSTKLGSE